MSVEKSSIQSFVAFVAGAEGFSPAGDVMHV
jgi:hypothetical protein